MNKRPRVTKDVNIKPRINITARLSSLAVFYMEFVIYRYRLHLQMSTRGNRLKLVKPILPL